MSQQNMPVAISRNMQPLVAAVPEQYAVAIANNFQGAMDDFGGTFRSISLKGFQFTLRESGSATIHPGHALQCVILGMAPDNHCIWFEKGYTGDTDGAKPDAVWWEKQGPPANVPASAMVKRADGNNQFQTKRRIVLALVRQNPQDGSSFLDFDNLFVLDVGAKSIFGKDYPDQMAFSLAGLMRFCTRARVNPCQFISQIIFDRTESVPAIRFQPTHQNGQLVFLPEQILYSVYAAGADPSLHDMLNVRLTNAADGAGAAAPAQAAPAPQAQPMPQPQVMPQQPVQAPQEVYGQYAQAAAPQPVAPPQPMQMVQPQAPMQSMPQAQPTQMVQPQAPMAQPMQQPMAQSQPQVAQPQPTPQDNAALLAQAQAASAAAAAMLQQPQAQPAQQMPQAAPQPMAQPQPMQQPQMAQPQAAPAGDAQSALTALLAQAGSYGAQG